MLPPGEPTQDPTVVITARGVEGGVPFVVYENTQGERWVIRGVCIACGECEVGAHNPDLIWTGLPVGTPGACLDRNFGLPVRKDVPVRPEISQLPHCTLWGEYL